MATLSGKFARLAWGFEISKNLRNPVNGDLPEPLAAAGMTASLAASSSLRRNIPVSGIEQRRVGVTQNPYGNETKVTARRLGATTSHPSYRSITEAGWGQSPRRTPDLPERTHRWVRVAWARGVSEKVQTEFPRGLESLCENIYRPRGTQVVFPLYPALRLRLRAGLSCPRPRGADFLALCTTVAARTLVLTQTLKPDVTVAANGTAEEAAEKVRKADSSRTKVRSEWQ